MNNGIFCPDCKTTIKNAKSLLQHQNSHKHRRATGAEDQKHYEASCGCGRQFNRKEGLEKHLERKICIFGRSSTNHRVEAVQLDADGRRDSGHGGPHKRLRHEAYEADAGQLDFAHEADSLGMIWTPSEVTTDVCYDADDATTLNDHWLRENAVLDGTTIQEDMLDFHHSEPSRLLDPNHTTMEESTVLPATSNDPVENSSPSVVEHPDPPPSRGSPILENEIPDYLQNLGQKELELVLSGSELTPISSHTGEHDVSTGVDTRENASLSFRDEASDTINFMAQYTTLFDSEISDDNREIRTTSAVFAETEVGIDDNSPKIYVGGGSKEDTPSVDASTNLPENPSLRQRIDARLAPGARVRGKSLKSVGAYRRHWADSLPECPICDKALPLDEEAIVLHFSMHINKNLSHLCHECGIAFTADDLRWHQAAVRSDQTCGFNFPHASGQCTGHHPPSKGLWAASAPSDHVRLHMWCLMPWADAVRDILQQQTREYFDRMTSHQRVVSMSWSISKCIRRPMSQISMSSLTSSIGALSISQRSEAGLRGSSRRINLTDIPAKFASKFGARTSVLTDEADGIEDVAASARSKELAEELVLACWRNDIPAVKRYIAAGVDVNFQLGVAAETALIAAASRGHHELIDVLVRAGAMVDLEVADHGTALAAAILHRQPGSVEQLLAHGARQENILGSQSAKELALALGIPDWTTEVRGQVSRLAWASFVVHEGSPAIYRQYCTSNETDRSWS